jgi:hypothetical protein
VTRLFLGGSSGVLSGALRPVKASIGFRRGIKAVGMWLSTGSVIAYCIIPRWGPRFALLQGCWRNGYQSPVLKHGPRSRTFVRVFGC